MTLRHMKIFLTVCQKGSVTAAARELYLSQPAVSLAVKEMEEHYGVPLFDRISKKLYLTQAGRQLMHYAERILSLFETVESGLGKDEDTGTLRIGSSITIGTHLLPSLVQMFSKRYSRMKIRVLIHNSDAIEEKLLKNEVDIGLIEGTVHSPNLTCHRFCEDRLVVVCAPEYPLAQKRIVTLEEFLQQNFLLREPGSGTRELLDQSLAVLGYAVEPLWESCSTQALIHGVKKGLGISVLPYLMVQQELQAGVLLSLPVEALSLQRYFSVVYHQNKYLSGPVKDFIALCFAQQTERNGEPCGT